MFVTAVRSFLDHHLNDWAAALTFYAGISLLPAIVIVVGILGLAGDSAVQEITDNLRDQDPGPVRDLALEGISEVSTNALNAGAALIVGVSARCGAPRATSAASCGPRAWFTEAARGIRSGGCARCRWP